jgi:hypothetical protein
VLESLIAVAQGARSFAVDARLMGNLAQDIAGVRAIREIMEEYVVRRFGYADAHITIDRKSWGGKYPEDMARAFGIVCYNAVSGVLAGADEFIANSVQEGVGIPLKEANADTLKAIHQVVGTMRGQRATLAGEEVETELAHMKTEMRAILDAALDLGEGDPALATIRGFQAGLLDIPFAASRHCRGEVMVARRHGRGALPRPRPRAGPRRGPRAPPRLPRTPRRRVRPADRLPDDRGRHLLHLPRRPGDGLNVMARLEDIARVIRSKNAGPYCVTLDILFGDEATYRRVERAGAITRARMAALYQRPV